MDTHLRISRIATKIAPRQGNVEGAECGPKRDLYSEQLDTNRARAHNYFNLYNIACC